MIYGLGTGDAAATPFKVRDASAGGTAKITVDFGTVNSIIPTMGSTGGDPLDADPAPELSSLVSGPVYLELTLYATDGTGYLKGDIQYAVIKNAASLPTPTATLARVLIATITVSGGNVTAISQAVTGSLGFLVCSGVQNFWQ